MVALWVLPYHAWIYHKNVTYVTTSPPSRSRCLQCFAELREPICPICGYDDLRHKHHPIYLPPLACLADQYLIGKTLGQGGFGITYLGLDQHLQKRVAIKEYLPAMLASRGAENSYLEPLKHQREAFAKGMNLFLLEARNLARFDHPHIVRVLNYFEANGTAYMVMEHVEGRSLAEQCAEGGLPPDQALALLRPILAALDAVHAEQIYHLDVSAHNVLVRPDGQPVLIDFGAARRMVGDYSHSISMVLKPGYSPLEQYSGGDAIGPWTDVYACGALLHWLLSGALPAAAPQRLSAPRLARIPGCPPWLARALRKALALRPEARYRSVKAFLRDLEPSSSGGWTPWLWWFALSALLAGTGAWWGWDAWHARSLPGADWQEAVYRDLPTPKPIPPFQDIPVDRISRPLPLDALESPPPVPRTPPPKVIPESTWSRQAFSSPADSPLPGMPGEPADPPSPVSDPPSMVERPPLLTPSF